MSSWLGLILTNLFSFCVGYITNVLAGPHTKRFTDWINTGPVRRVLQLGQNDDTVVVIPLHKIENGRSLPYAAVEDVYALRNVLALLTDMGIKPKVRDPDHIDDVVTQNVISIGGPKRNSFTKYILSEAQKTIKFVHDRGTDQTEIHRGQCTRHISDSYSKPEGEKCSDMAVLLRCQNPRNVSNAVIIIAGIRGIGTWGASDYLRKHARGLAHRLDEKQKHTGFLAEIEVEYEKLNIGGKLTHIEAL